MSFPPRMPRPAVFGYSTATPKDGSCSPPPNVHIGKSGGYCFFSLLGVEDGQGQTTCNKRSPYMTHAWQLPCARERDDDSRVIWRVGVSYLY